MSDEQVEKLLDKVRERRGMPTKASEARAAAVNGLLGRPQQQELRPGAQALADSIRKGR